MARGQNGKEAEVIDYVLETIMECDTGCRQVSAHLRDVAVSFSLDLGGGASRLMARMSCGTHRLAFQKDV